MKEKVNWFSIFLGLMVVFYATASGIFIPPIRARAVVPSSQKVVGHSASWGSYDFSYSFHQKYYTIQDATGIPTSTLLTAQYFYTSDNVTFCALSSTDLITIVLNKGLGLILDPDRIPQYVTAFLTAIGPNHLDTTDSKYAQGGLYDSSDNFLGYCLNDISGCYWNGINPNSYTIPSQTVANVYNFNEYYNTDSPDYFTWYPLSNQTIINNFGNPTNLSQTSKDNLLALNSENIAFYDGCNSQNKHYMNIDADYVSSSDFNVWTGDCDYLYCISSETDWNSFCEHFKVQNNELLATEVLYDITSYSSNKFIEVYSCLNDNSYAVLTKYNYSTNTYASNTKNRFYIGAMNQGSFGIYFKSPFNKNITIYKNQNVKTNIQNNNYSPTYYTTSNYGDTLSNNDLSATAVQLNQSVSYNTSIYQNALENTQNYYDNGYYDSSSQITNITNVTNNYYEYGQPTQPDNPTDPDNPSGGGGSGSGDSGDSPIWNALLEGLLRFLQAIGEVIGTLIAGLLDIFADIIEALGGITESLGSIGTFISQIFSFLPSSLVSILVAAISFCTLCAIIKFIRG